VLFENKRKEEEEEEEEEEQEGRQEARKDGKNKRRKTKCQLRPFHHHRPRHHHKSPYLTLSLNTDNGVTPSRPSLESGSCQHWAHYIKDTLA